MNNGTGVSAFLNDPDYKEIGYLLKELSDRVIILFSIQM
jgi:hypothetical protein